MILGSFVVLSLTTVLIGFFYFNWPRKEEANKALPEQVDDAGSSSVKNINVAYLYVHKTTGELQLVVKPRKDPIVPHIDSNLECIDVWWEDPNEQASAV
jgi:hypothetical protein